MKYPRLITNRCKYIPTLIKDMDVLDVGCVEHSIENRRTGRWLHEHLRRSASRILGLDYEHEEINKLRREGYNVLAADATAFEIDRQFDAVVAGELIEHLSNPGLFLECAHAHLSDEGLMVLTTPNANCLIYFLENLLLGKEIDNPDHVSLYSPTTISLLLKRHGFCAEAIVFLAENTTYCHDSRAAKIAVMVKQIAQLVFGYVRPSLCHHMVVVARKKNSEQPSRES